MYPTKHQFPNSSRQSCTILRHSNNTSSRITWKPHGRIWSTSWTCPNPTVLVPSIPIFQTRTWLRCRIPALCLYRMPLCQLLHLSQKMSHLIIQVSSALFNMFGKPLQYLCSGHALLFIPVIVYTHPTYLWREHNFHLKHMVSVLHRESCQSQGVVTTTYNIQEN